MSAEMFFIEDDGEQERELPYGGLCFDPAPREGDFVRLDGTEYGVVRVKHCIWAPRGEGPRHQVTVYLVRRRLP